MALAVVVSLALFAGCGSAASQPDMAPPDMADGAVSPDGSITPGPKDRILFVGIIVAPTGPFAGELLVEDDLITCVASSCSAMPGAQGVTVVHAGGFILPGLIDAHNHGLYNIFDEHDWTPLHFYQNHTQWTAEERYGEVVDAKQYLDGESTDSPVDYRCEMDKYAEIKALIAGTTSFLLAPSGASRTCYSSLARTIDTPQNGLAQDKIQTSISIPSNTTAQSICENFASEKTDAYVVHVAEGIDATARNEFTTLSSRAGGCLLSSKTAIVHGTALGAAEFETMAAHGMKLVWSPRSNEFLYGEGNTTRIDLALAAGVQTIALAPDWALGGSINLLDELRYAHEVDVANFGGLLSPQRLFEMVTIEAARVLAVDAQVGSLEEGKRADLMIVSAEADDPYAALLGARPEDVRLVLVDGRVLYGDLELAVLGPTLPGCEELSICGHSKFICVATTASDNKLNQTYAEIHSTLTDALLSYDETVMVGAPGFSPIAPLTTCP